MSSPRTTALTVAGITVCGLVGYAFYFDYKRRNDVEFRKQLRKQKKRVDKSLAESREALEATSTSNISDEELVAALKAIEEEPKPGPDIRENYFMSQVAMGEQMAARGAGFELEAAMAFYRALAVYPSPPELLNIYQKTVPEGIVKLILRLINTDLVNKVGAYWGVFPPAWSKVTVRQERPADAVTFGPEMTLVLTEDVAAGEVIYKEQPMLTCLDFDLQKAGTHCAHCFRLIADAEDTNSPPSSPETLVAAEESSPEKPVASKPSETLESTDGTKLAFCSKSCKDIAATRWHTFLHTLNVPLPALEDQLTAMGVLSSPEILALRREAQAKLRAYLEKDSRVGTFLVAQFIARQLTASTEGQDTSRAVDYAGADSEEEKEKYRIEDHVERWTAGAKVPPEDEYAVVSTMLKTTLPGLEAFLTDDSHKRLSAQLDFNTFGVCFGESGRADRPASTLRPEDAERTRTPLGTAHQTGTAVYAISAYLPHSCEPNAVPTFPAGTNELSVVALKDLKKGDELAIAYVDVKQRPGESETDCRMRRRKELAYGWKFACQCTRCLGEVTKLLDVEDAAARAGASDSA